MKKGIAALMVCVLVLLVGCSGFTVEDMLSAPALTADQSAVLAALGAHYDEKTVLKYPAAGERRAPIQFVDMDADGVGEAVVFFSVPAEDVYAMLAVLKKTNDAWRIAGVQKGAGTDVESISVIRLEDATGRFLLVEWSNTNSRGNQLSAYHFEDGQITPGFEDACSDILVYDLDGDGFKEFCYITAGSATEPYMLKFVDNSAGLLALTGECRLGADMLSSVHIAAGVLADGRQAVFVDENVGDSMMQTEVFTLENNSFVPVPLADGYDLAEISRRSLDSLLCQPVFGGSKLYMPSQQPPYVDVHIPDQWTYWYTVRDDGIAYAGASYVDKIHNIAIAVPDEWLGSVAVTSNIVDQPRLIEMYDVHDQSIKLRVKILEIGEDSASYISNGFSLITQSGSYRYYVQGNCTPDELNYVKNNFSIL